MAMRIILSFSLLLISVMTMSQNVIKADISITMKVNESFELQFLDSPGAGYLWSHADQQDSTKIVISFIKNELMEGDKPKGCRYISTNKYTGLMPGDYFIDYIYGRRWMHELVYTCRLKIKII
jgi:hypothetical protein